MAEILGVILSFILYFLAVAYLIFAIIDCIKSIKLNKKIEKFIDNAEVQNERKRYRVFQ